MARPPAKRALRGLAVATVSALALAVPGIASAAPAKPGPRSQPPATSEPQSQRTVEVQILGLSETHGQLNPLARERRGPLAGGGAVLATYLEQEKAENPRTLILDSGDFMQGPVISSFFEGASTVDVYNAIGVDAPSSATTSSTTARTSWPSGSRRPSSRSSRRTSSTSGPARRPRESSRT